MSECKMKNKNVIPFKASLFTADAKKRWDRIPKWAQTGILDSVYCVKCSKSVPIVLETAKMQRDDLILRGKCKICGHEVCRLVEPENG